MNKILIGISVAILTVICSVYVYSRFNYPEYIISDSLITDISQEPVQIEDNDTILPRMVFRKGIYFFTVKAKYNLVGQLTCSKRYYTDFASKVSPWDYAIAWGNVSNILPYVKFIQTHRFSLYRYKYGAPIDQKYLETHNSNNHLIPATDNLRKALRLAKKGDLIGITGYLVNVQGNINKRGSSNWNTSLTRSDTGNGACEIIYLTKLQINNKVFQ